MKRIISIVLALLFALPALGQTIELKMYPAPTAVGSQRTNDTAVPLNWLKGQLAAIEAATPAEERATLEMRGWQGVSIWSKHTLTPTERLQQQVATLIARQREVIDALERGGLSDTDRKRLLDLLKSP